MLDRQLFLPLCRADRLLFLQHIKEKKFFNIQAGPNYFFFTQKQRQIIFSKILPARPPPPDNEMVAP